MDGTATLGTVTLSRGMASLSFSTLSPGSQTITTRYGGGPDFLASNSAPLIETIRSPTSPPTPGPPGSGVHHTRTVLTAKPNPATVGGRVTFTATVKNRSRSGGVPTGDITFLRGTAVLETALLRSGRATLSVSTLPLGHDTIQAKYAGDAEFTRSSSSISERVRPAQAKRKVASSRQATASARAVRSMETGKASPTGPVLLPDGSTATILGTVPASGDKATLKASLLADGTHSVRLAYNPNTGFGPSSASLKKNVKQAKLPVSIFSTPLYII